MSLFSGLARGVADMMSFGGNELAGNPVGKAWDTIVDGKTDDPNAFARDLNSQQLDLARQNMAMQKEFAQNGIQWRVADAAKAGLSPLAALGAAEPNYSPVAAVFTGGEPPDRTPRNVLLSTLSGMGQDLFRSRLSGMSEDDRLRNAMQLKLLSAQADEATAQAARAKLALAKESAAPVNPAVPTLQSFRNPDGSIQWMPSEEYARAATADPTARIRYMWNERIARPLSDTWWNIRHGWFGN